MSDRRRRIAFAVVLVGACTLSCRFQLEPTFSGRVYCFTADSPYGHKIDGQVAAIHDHGQAVKLCLCYCDDLHADTQLFTGPNPPPPSQDWLDEMAEHRSFAVQHCQDLAASLELVDDNCDDVIPAFPSWADVSKGHQCYGRPQPDGYCTEPDELGDGSDGGTGDDPPIDPGNDPPFTRARSQLASP